MTKQACHSMAKLRSMCVAESVILDWTLFNRMLHSIL